MNDSYVYLHIHHDTGYPVIFYVGKGRLKRAWTTKRNLHWVNVVNKHGILSRFVNLGFEIER